MVAITISSQLDIDIGFSPKRCFCGEQAYRRRGGLAWGFNPVARETAPNRSCSLPSLYAQACAFDFRPRAADRPPNWVARGGRPPADNQCQEGHQFVMQAARANYPEPWQRRRNCGNEVGRKRIAKFLSLSANPRTTQCHKGLDASRSSSVRNRPRRCALRTSVFAQRRFGLSAVIGLATRYGHRPLPSVS
jgi:hypothetical protein